MSDQFKNLLIHPSVKARLELIKIRPSHAVLLTGPNGAGKASLGRALCATVLDLPVEKLDSYPFFAHIKPPKEGQEISIDTTRDILRKLRLKTTGQNQIRRVFLIENAHQMSLEAQNAILKMLEEPPADTVFILTAALKTALLPTIISRCQEIYVHPVSLDLAIQFFGDSFDDKDIQSAWLISQGGAGLLKTILDDQDNHSLKTTIGDVKSLLKQSPYERLLTIEKYNESKASLALLLEALAKILAALNQATIAKHNTKQSARILDSRRQVHEIQKALQVNVASRLAILKLVLNLKV